MSAEQHKASDRRGFEALNQNNLAVFDELCAPDFVVHGTPPTQGLEAFKQSASEFFTAFPDLHYTIEDMIAEGDKVVARYTLTGTHQGDFMGIPATGKQINVTGISIVRFANEKAVELWGNADELGMMQQLGVVPTLGQVS